MFLKTCCLMKCKIALFDHALNNCECQTEDAAYRFEQNDDMRV